MQRVLKHCFGVELPAETHYFDDFRPGVADARGPMTSQTRSAAERYFRSLHPHGFVGRDRAETDETRWARIEAFLASSGNPSLDRLFEAHCRYGTSATNPSMCWGEKTPRHVYRVDDMLEAFPAARIIVMCRDPRGVVHSYKHWAIAKKEQLGRSAVEWRRIRASSNPGLQSILWRGAMRAAAEAIARHGEERIRVVRYERLVLDSEAELDALGRWIGLRRRLVRLGELGVVNSSFDRGGDDPRARVDAWRRGLSESDMAAIALFAGSEGRRLGYPIPSVSRYWLRLSGCATKTLWSAGAAAVANRSRIRGLFDYVRRRL